MEVESGKGGVAERKVVSGAVPRRVCTKPVLALELRMRWQNLSRETVKMG